MVVLPAASKPTVYTQKIYVYTIYKYICVIKTIKFRIEWCYMDESLEDFMKGFHIFVCIYKYNKIFIAYPSKYAFASFRKDVSAN